MTRAVDCRDNLPDLCQDMKVVRKHFGQMYAGDEPADQGSELPAMAMLDQLIFLVETTSGESPTHQAIRNKQAQPLVSTLCQWFKDLARQAERYKGHYVPSYVSVTDIDCTMLITLLPKLSWVCRSKLLIMPMY